MDTIHTINLNNSILEISTIRGLIQIVAVSILAGSRRCLRCYFCFVCLHFGRLLFGFHFRRLLFGLRIDLVARLRFVFLLVLFLFFFLFRLLTAEVLLVFVHLLLFDALEQWVWLLFERKGEREGVRSMTNGHFVV